MPLVLAGSRVPTSNSALQCGRRHASAAEVGQRIPGQSAARTKVSSARERVALPAKATAPRSRALRRVGSRCEPAGRPRLLRGAEERDDRQEQGLGAAGGWVRCSWLLPGTVDDGDSGEFRGFGVHRGSGRTKMNEDGRPGDGEAGHGGRARGSVGGTRAAAAHPQGAAGFADGRVAQRTGLGRTTISQAMNGQAVPSEATLVALAKALGADLGPMLALREAAARIPRAREGLADRSRSPQAGAAEDGAFLRGAVPQLRGGTAFQADRRRAGLSRAGTCALAAGRGVLELGTGGAAGGLARRQRGSEPAIRLGEACRARVGQLPTRASARARGERKDNAAAVAGCRHGTR